MVTNEPAFHPSDYDSELADLNQLLLATDTFTGFLTELVHYTAKATEHACSITVGANGTRPYTIASSDEISIGLDEYQYTDRKGPCLEALSTGVPVFVTDMATETRWGPYPAHALSLGARSSVSYPLINADRTLGALNMYAFRPLTPDPVLQTRAAQLADRAAGALAVALRLAEQADEAAHLRTALGSRSVIDQAIGILMGQQRCTPDAAFDLIRQASQARNIKLRDIATQIVHGVSRNAPGNRNGRY